MAKFEGGDGSCFNTAIRIVGVDDHTKGVNAEYEYISLHYGVEEKDWYFVSQKLLSKNGSPYDLIEFRLKNNKVFQLFFDISDFFGKCPIMKMVLPGIDIKDIFKNFYN